MCVRERDIVLPLKQVVDFDRKKRSPHSAVDRMNGGPSDEDFDADVTVVIENDLFFLLNPSSQPMT